MTSNGIRWLFWGKSQISDIPMLQKIAECLFIQQEGVYIWVVFSVSFGADDFFQNVKNQTIWNKYHILSHWFPLVSRKWIFIGWAETDITDIPFFSCLVMIIPGDPLLTRHQSRRQAGFFVDRKTGYSPRNWRRNWGCCLPNLEINVLYPQILWFIIIFAIDNTHIYIYCIHILYLYAICAYVCNVM